VFALCLSLGRFGLNIKTWYLIQKQLRFHQTKKTLLKDVFPGKANILKLLPLQELFVGFVFACIFMF